MCFTYSFRKMAKLFANSGDPDQTPQNAASDLGLHCFLITFLESPDENGFIGSTKLPACIDTCFDVAKSGSSKRDHKSRYSEQ